MKSRAVIKKSIAFLEVIELFKKLCKKTNFDNIPGRLVEVSEDDNNAMPTKVNASPRLARPA